MCGGKRWAREGPFRRLVDRIEFGVGRPNRKSLHQWEGTALRASSHYLILGGSAYGVAPLSLVQQETPQKARPVLRSVLSCGIDGFLCRDSRSSCLSCKTCREPPGSLSLLCRTVKMDQWVHDIAAGQAPKGLHPHRQITFLHIQ